MNDVYFVNVIYEKRKPRRAALALVAVAMLLPTLSGCGGARRRGMPFLARDAVVRDSGQGRILVDIKRGLVPILSYRSGRGGRAGVRRKQVAIAAATLSQILLEMTGRRPPRLRNANKADKSDKTAAAEAPRVELLAGDVATAAFPELKGHDGHGFVIAAAATDGPAKLRIAAITGAGVRFGVNFLLMNYLGVRIVLPGPLGRVIARRQQVLLPSGLYVHNRGPDFELRLWNAVGGFDPVDWLGDTGWTQRYRFHHNVGRIYDPARFGRKHPAYYPVRGGRPAIPAAGALGGWQPTFSRPDAVRRAIDYADERFAGRPHERSLSLSVNDGGGYSEVDIRRGRRLADGTVSVSDPYYRYTNAVAAGIQRRWPGRSVAALAYARVREPPSFKLHDKVIPFLVHEPLRELPKWRGKYKRFGVYQWLFGRDWLLPNHFPHALQALLKTVRDRGGRLFMGESYPAWANDGPKMWVLCNLLWNADADVDALLADYYRHTYGPQAAPAVARYFAAAEAIYERRRTQTELKLSWAYPGPAQFTHVAAADMAMMRAALRVAQAKVEGERNARRLAMLVRAFDWADLYWQRHDALRRLRTATITTEEHARAAIAAAGRFVRLPREQRAHFEARIRPHLQLTVFARHRDLARLTAAQRRRLRPPLSYRTRDPVINRAFAAITALWRRKLGTEGAARRWRKVAADNPLLGPFVKTRLLALDHPRATFRNLLPGGSFERDHAPGSAISAAGPQPDRRRLAGRWFAQHHRLVSAAIGLDTTTAKHGRVSATARGMSNTSGVRRDIHCDNGAQYRLSFWYRTTPQVRRVSRLIRVWPPILEHLPAAARWTRVSRVFTVRHPTAAGGDVTILLTLRRGESADAQVWFDDVRLEKLAPDGLAGAPKR